MEANCRIAQVGRLCSSSLRLSSQCICFRGLLLLIYLHSLRHALSSRFIAIENG